MASSYSAWPHTGSSFDIASTVICLATTNLAAFLSRIYISTRHSQSRQNRTTVLICVGHLAMVAQSITLVMACYWGLGSSLEQAFGGNMLKAERAYFASNLLLLIVHGLSRACIGLTLLHAGIWQTRTRPAVTFLCAIALWTVGSATGMIVSRALKPSFWSPIGQDLRFKLWAPIYLIGLTIDLAIAGEGARLVLPLQMTRTKKAFAISVFGVGILVNVPIAYGLAYLHSHSTTIASDPFLNAGPFVRASQAAIAVSLWSRALEAARMLGSEVGYATFGRSQVQSGSYLATITPPTGFYSKPPKSPSTKATPSRPTFGKHSNHIIPAEDEIELRATNVALSHTVDVSKHERDSRSRSFEGIQVTTEYGYTDGQHL